jgi:hypothetical protein
MTDQDLDHLAERLAALERSIAASDRDLAQLARIVDKFVAVLAIHDRQLAARIAEHSVIPEAPHD